MSEGRFVYVIGPRDGPYKIGIASNVDTRRSIANVGNHLYLFLHFKFEAGSKEEARRIEREVHFHFQAKHIRGEWFDLGPSDLPDIRQRIHTSMIFEVAPEDWSLKRKTDEEFVPGVCRRARMALELTQEQLSERAQVPLKVLQEFEAGRGTPITRTLEALRAALEREGVEFIVQGPDLPLRILV